MEEDGEEEWEEDYAFIEAAILKFESPRNTL
jgi:hypothetical protein